jgi:hypothetical protein
MKKFYLGAVIVIIFLSNNVIFAQDDDVPYLSDDDIAAIEMSLPDDVPEVLQNRSAEVAVETNVNNEGNEISRLNTSQKIYHLLILDRASCPLNSDISGINDAEILYKYKHGANGYLIAIYTSPQDGPLFPQLPNRSRILVNLITVRENTIKEYINSSAFRRFVTSPMILSEIQEVLDTKL